MHFTLLLVFIAAVNLLSGCASMINSASQRMAENLSLAMMKQNDPETVKAAAPAYMVMLDSMVEGDPHNTATLRSAARLYGAYTSAFVSDEQRARRLAEKSYIYAKKALCLELQAVCEKLDASGEELQSSLQNADVKQVPLLYDFARAWAGWIQVNSADWNAIAQIPKLTLLFNTLVSLDEQHDAGGAHLYLGVLHSQLPPSVGGKPEQGQYHFDRAQQLSEGKNLMVNVLYAEHYARLVFDQPLHDQLLKQVLASESDEPGLALTNALARARAAVLLNESNEFF